uniref:ABC transporter ATP-binding protein n=2 Tax=Strongyloides papillosus TaxID=174720 RepID=A0A0N5BHN6_STREA
VIQKAHLIFIVWTSRGYVKVRKGDIVINRDILHSQFIVNKF